MVVNTATSAGAIILREIEGELKDRTGTTSKN